MRKLHHHLARREHNAMLSDDTAAPQDRKADLSNQTLVCNAVTTSPLNGRERNALAARSGFA